MPGGQVIGEAFVRVGPDMDGFAQSAESETQAAADGIGSKLKLALAATGLLAGAALTKGLMEAMGQDKSVDLMAAQLGATPAEAKKYGDVAGKLFTSAVTEDFAQGTEVIKSIMQQGILPPEASEAQLASIATKISDVSTLMGEDISKTTAAVGTMLKTGMAKDATEALDIITRGMQIGANKAEDLLDTFVEYSTQFRKVGLDGKQALGLVQQALQGGARDADTAADAIKEFSLLSIDGSKGAADAYKALGLDAKTMIDTFAKGGPAAQTALDTIFDRIHALKDPVDKNTVSIGLFGTKAEDLGAALDSMDPSTAVAALGDVAGAADKAGDTMRDNASTKIEMFKRKVIQAFVEVLGDKVLPKVIVFGRAMKDEFGPPVRDAARWARDDLVPVLRDVAGWLDEHVVPAAVATGRVVRDDVVPAMRDAATWIGNNKEPLLAVAAAIMLFLLPAMIAAGVTATISATTQVTAWVLTKTTATTSAATSVAAHWATIGGWIAAAGAAVFNAAVVVGGWVLMGTQATIRAAQMAAAWIVAMGPIAWVTVAVIAIAALIVYYWDEIVAGTRAAWSWVTGLVTGAWDAITGAVSAAADWVSARVNRFKDAVTDAFSDMKVGAVRKANELADWMRGLPGQLLDALGDLGGLLYGAGQDVGRGLLNGILSMGGSIKSTITGWVSDVIPGPVKKALGIGSPSKVMRDQVGRWIPAGIVQGIATGAPAVEAAMRGLVPDLEMPDPAALTAAVMSPQRANAIPATGDGLDDRRDNRGGGLRIENYYESGNDPAAVASELDWLARGRG